MLKISGKQLKMRKRDCRRRRREKLSSKILLLSD
jgi:hypothetical protein